MPSAFPSTNVAVQETVSRNGPARLPLTFPGARSTAVQAGTHEVVTILPATAPPYQCRASLTIGSGPGGPSGSPDAEVAGWSSARSSPSTIRSSRPRSSSKCEISSEWHGIFHRSGSRICHQMALSRFDAGTSALWLSRSGVPGMHLRSEAPWAPVAPTPRRGVSRTRRWLGSESACCAREPVPFGDKSCCHSREISHL